MVVFSFSFQLKENMLLTGLFGLQKTSRTTLPRSSTIVALANAEISGVPTPTLSVSMAKNVELISLLL